MNKRRSPSGFRATPRAILQALFLCVIALSLSADPLPQKIVVAAGDQFRPEVFRNEQGVPEGIHVDLWRLWSQKTGVEVSWKLMPWTDALPSLLRGDVDAVSGVTYTAERAEIMDFSRPFGQVSAYIFFHQDLRGIRGLQDLKGFPVGVLGGTNTEDFVQKKAPELRLVAYPSYEEMVQAAVENRLLVFVGEEPCVSHFLAKTGKVTTLRRTESPLLVNEFRMAVRKGNKDLVRVLDDGLLQISPQEMKSIEEQWTGARLKLQIPWRRMISVAAVLGLLGLSLVAWIVLLRMRVQKITRSVVESEHRYRALVENSPVGIWHVTADGRTIYANPALCEYLQVSSPEEVKDKPWQSFLTPESVDTVQKEEAHRPQGVASSYEIELLGRKGRRRQCIVHGAPILSKEGRLEATMGSFLDITERKGTERALAQRVAFERLVSLISTRFSHADSSALFKGMDQSLEEIGCFLGVDRAYVLLFSENHQEFSCVSEWAVPEVQRQMSVVQRVPTASMYWWLQKMKRGEMQVIRSPEDLPADQVQAKTLMEKTGIRAVIEMPLVCAGSLVGVVGMASVGEERMWNEDAITLLKSVAEILANAVDRQRMESELLHREELFRTYFEMGLIGMAMLSPDKRFIHVNDRLCQILGYSKEELLERSWLDLTHPEDLEKDLEPYDKLLRGEVDHYTTEKRYLHKEGGLVHVILYVTCVRTQSGQVNRVIAHMEDITDRKRVEEDGRRLEQALQQSQKVQAIGKLAGGIAHDFNNILMPILGNTEMIMSQHSLDSEIRIRMAEIQQAAEHARELTKRLLAFGRKQVVELKVVDLGRLVSDFEPMLRRTIREDVAIRTRIEVSAGNVKADAAQIQQIIMNLCANAQDAMPDGGEMTLEVKASDETGADLPIAPGSYVMLSVSDTGHGMDSEIMNRLFEPFFTTKQRGQGTGLGLPVVEGIVQQHRGHVEVTSFPEQGTSVRVLFPRVDEPVAPPPPRVPTPGRLDGHETLLLLEDNQMVRDLVTRILKKHGYRVLAFGEASKCFRHLEEHRELVHLLLTDVIMPEMNGKEVYQKMRSLYSGIRVIYMSGYTEDVIAHHGVLEEGVSFLQKPFATEVLLHKIREILDRG